MNLNNSFEEKQIIKDIRKAFWYDKVKMETYLDIFPNFILKNISDIDIEKVTEINWEIWYIVKYLKNNKKYFVYRNQISIFNETIH